MITAAQTQTLVNQVSATRLMATINTLSAFLTRDCRTTEWEDVSDSVIAMFRSAGITQIATHDQLNLDYTGFPDYNGYANVRNIICTIEGTLFPNKYIDVSAHYDSYSVNSDFFDNAYEVAAPGADDNGTGVSALIEMAKLIIDSKFRPLISIRFIAFAGEEVAMLGSTAYIDECATADMDIVCNINMDMLGYAPTSADEVKLKLHPYDSDDAGAYSYANQALAIIPAYTDIATVSTEASNSHVSDSYRYFVEGYKSIYLEESTRTHDYHWDTDLPATVNQDYLAETTKAAFACLCYFSGISQALNTTTQAVSNNMINYNLSTLSSIARHEAEINNLAQRYTRKALSVASTVQMTANPDTITAIVAMTSAGTAVTLTKGATTWALPLGEYVRFICATEDTYFSLLEGTGSVITSADGDYTLALASAPSWTDAELVKDWQDKIDLANEMIYNDIYLSLSAYTSQDQISTVIAELDNPQLLCIASDYKTLELIFMDLWGKIGNAEAIGNKIDFYRAKYDEAYRTAFKSLDFGDYGHLFETGTGRVTR